MRSTVRTRRRSRTPKTARPKVSADVAWPEPSPLSAWWEQVMFPDGHETSTSR
ncbi:hypothetical protein JK358_18545 [Nocardia sp. 2]|uniref:Uncharacterized protein n=1 Tax=Nocardia acididurans TaxID=2802282 RepID=A0ABS1M700_9NOCA|nr:hypothetical protein [Nocardia acididurans]MBL1076400.1 hypothetical protein [Nocardia acididurans]